MADFAELDILWSLRGRTIVSATLGGLDDSELAILLDDTRVVTVTAHAHDEAWLTIDE